MKRNLTLAALPRDIVDFLSRLGENLKLARLRRNMTQKELAAAMFTTRQTVARLEAGDAGISLGMFLTAAFCLRRFAELRGMLSPETDIEGFTLERRRLLRCKGGRKEKNVDELDF